MVTRATIALGLGLGLCAASCSSQSREGAKATHDAGSGSRDPAFDAIDASSTPASGGPDVGNVTPGSACATAGAGATRPPVHLVFIYNRSISMGFDVGGTTVWDACKAGLTSFFASASSAGLRASLAFFGKDNTLDSVATCSASSYATPEVKMTALPNASLFANAIDATNPYAAVCEYRPCDVVL